jgi:hypothetical protein
MKPLSLSFAAVCFMTLLAAILGWLAPPTSDTFKRREAALVLAGIAFACWRRLDFSNALIFTALFPGVYLAFNGWRGERTPPKRARFAAFFGASFFMMCTTRRLDQVLIAMLLGLGAYALGLWLIERGNRRLALALVMASVVFELTRVSVLLAS